MPREIVLVRHGETTSNRAGRWEGRGDSPLTEHGERQVALLASRLRRESFAAIVASDLGRARTTAAAIGDGRVVTDAMWVEADLGRWEGLTRSDILARYPDEIGALARGADEPMGGGERPSEIAARVREAFAVLVERLADGERGLVVSHGGAITALVTALLGADSRRWPLGQTLNAAITRIRAGDGWVQITAYNDDTHLAEAPPRSPESVTEVVLVRHGETVANAAGVWQGRMDGRLTLHGREQAERLAAAAPALAALYTSPLRRARDTAKPLASRQRLAAETLDGVVEIAMGAWEGLSPEEIQGRYPELWRAVIDQGEDLPRGHTGERFTDVAERMRVAIEGVAARHEGERVGVVSHGGAIRAYVTLLLGLGFGARRRLASPGNVSMSRIVWGPLGARLAAYNVIPAPAA